ncbi:ABC-type lipoprotein export system ATPase subunit [Azospirillum brasilense]|uniref:ABC-type lipoprotein export system ATPase subunit n=1 Tax=Azospirillum brasilense TaxID=192 RepID=A0A560BCC1_AZOBR|nr:ATP-binding cassette domain-containing protein [Azospirillum brasilense]TWA70182.1 ABC-type lipoprotein export system ATPase subunit [Azospirillum brasilense]
MTGAPLRSLTILGGRDKTGRPEVAEVTLRAGDVACIVGPTGSGKSRLLADIECLAQGDTPSGRRVLIDGAEPEPALRFAAHRKPVAQLSQTMTFVVDLTVGEFVAMHACCRGVPDAGRRVPSIVAAVIAGANDLSGEPFGPDAALAELSGGQSRALMIADTALLSASPIVLIDEIENAGIDRRRALDLLMGEEKIVLISTHDPILALLGQQRLVIRNGGIAEVIATGPDERASLEVLTQLDRALLDLRERLRAGRRIDRLPDWPAILEIGNEQETVSWKP